MFTEEELANEEWRPVVGYENYLEVSNIGRVRSKDRTIKASDGRVYRRSGKLLSLKPAPDGTVVVHTGIDGVSKRFTVHRIVAEAFIPCDDRSLAVLHRNLLRNDNRVENLYWGAGKRRCNKDGEYNPEKTHIKHVVNIENILDEEWRDVVGFEGMYRVSSAGRVLSLKTNLILAQNKKENGYMKVTLRKGGQSVNKHVHRLVAEAFIERPDGCDQINHIDEDKENNYVENLEWCTQKYNNEYGTRTARAVAHRDYTKTSGKNKPVLQSDLKGNVIKRWSSISEASRSLGFSISSISCACRRTNEPPYKHGRTHGYKWDFEEDYVCVS